jgi:hypothetical protein
MSLRARVVEERKATQGHGRMHSGPSPGAPKGNKNALKHGRYTAEAMAERRAVRALLRGTSLRMSGDHARSIAEPAHPAARFLRTGDTFPWCLPHSGSMFAPSQAAPRLRAPIHANSIYALHDCFVFRRPSRRNERGDMAERVRL